MILFIILTQLIAFIGKTSTAGTNEYYQELKKLKSYNKKAISELKNNHVISERQKKANERTAAARQSKAASDQRNNGEKETTFTNNNNEKITGSKVENSRNRSATITKTKPSQTSSAPIEVKHDTPDELNFPGTGE